MEAAAVEDARGIELALEFLVDAVQRRRQRLVARHARRGGAGAEQRGVAAGGHATLFRAGAAPAGVPRHQPLAPPLDRIHQELKRQFDPAGIFNRGRLHPDL